MLTRLFILVLLTQITACSLLGDRRDTPWDPKGSKQLMDQIPNWDSEANSVCGGHLPPEQRGGRSPRC